MRAAIIILALLIPATVIAAPLININTASASLLDTLPGIGPSKAEAIIDYRTTHGQFKTIEEIQEVKGIGPTTFANLKSSITVDTVTTVVQPAAPAVSSKQVQTVEKITNTKTAVQPDEEPVIAPAAATQIAAAGAALPDVSRSSGIFNSVWTLGLIGVILIASGAFIFL